MQALDLFAGAGGWDVAAARLGITAHGVENMTAARATRDAAELSTIHDDVWTLGMAAYGTRYEGHIASPPCQTFSAAGKGSGRKALDDVLRAIESGAYCNLDRLRGFGGYVGDERTALVLTPLHYAVACRPEWIAWEQVPTVLPVWEACAEVLRAEGYSVWTGNLHAEQYGVPQTRKRAVLLASRVREVTAPVPTHSRYYPRSPDRLDPGVLPWVSMAQALGGCAPFTVVSNYGTGGDPAARGERTSDQPAATVTSKVDRCRVVLRNNNTANAAVRCECQPAPTMYFGQRCNYVAWEGRVFCGAGATSEQTAGQVPRTPDQPAHTITGKGTAAWREPLPEWAHNRPSTTVVGSFKPEVVAAPGYRTTVSPQNAPDSVRVTVAEAGVLQSFPAEYPWQGAKGKQYLQCGNAIPPGLALAALAEVTGLSVTTTDTLRDAA